MDAEKTAEAVLLCALKMAFTASLLGLQYTLYRLHLIFINKVCEALAEVIVKRLQNKFR